MTVRGSLPGSLASHITDQGVHGRARCWKITSTILTGRELRLTDHRQNLTLSDGLTYSSTQGGEGSSIQKQTYGDIATNRSVRGFLSANIGEAVIDDLVQGVYDGATVDEYTVDPRFAWAGMIGHQRFRVRKVLVQGELWSFDCEGLLSELNRSDDEEWSVLCRSRVFAQGSRRCGLATGAFSLTGNLLSAIEDKKKLEILTAPNTLWQEVGYGDGGTVTFNTGPLAGLRIGLKRWTLPITSIGEAEFVEKTPYSFNPGDNVTLLPGCDKTLGTCIRKFDNAINFQGEPHLRKAPTKPLS